MMAATEHDTVYWKYEYDVADLYLRPLLERWGIPPQGLSVLDVGCAEGGGLCALHDRGADCVGFDIDEKRVLTAQALQGKRTIELRTGNLYSNDLPFSDRRFDLVTLHDVFEHLDDKDTMIKKLGGYLKPAGKLLITFPPFYSAYGGHQQHLQVWYAKLPFFHLVPLSMSVVAPRIKDIPPQVVEEVQKLRRLKMGMRSFEMIVRSSDLLIERRQAYLISPNHIRFGLRPVEADLLSRIPILREFICSGVVYLLGLASEPHES